MTITIPVGVISFTIGMTFLALGFIVGFVVGAIIENNALDEIGE